MEATAHEEVIDRIVKKYCWEDVGLQEDCKQEARLALLSIDDCHTDSYIRAAIRNAVLNTLTPYKTGNWYYGRKGKLPRYVSIEDLLRMGCDISDREEVVGHFDLAMGMIYGKSTAAKRKVR